MNMAKTTRGAGAPSRRWTLLPIVVVGLTLLAAVGTAAFPVSEAPSQGEVLLLELLVHGRRIPEELVVAVVTDGMVLLPLYELSAILGFGPEQPHREEKYVSGPQFDDMFGTQLLVDVGLAVLHVEGDTPLPVLERLRREERWRRLPPPGADIARAAADGRWKVEPYKFLQVNAFEHRTDFRARTPFGERTPAEANLSWEVSAAGELLYMTAFLDLEARDDPSAPEVSRFTLQRIELEPILLGPLRARRVTVGDVIHPGLSLVTPPTRGRGVVIGNASPNRAAVFDSIPLTGPLSAGWDVELYRGSVLVDYRRAIEDGSYSFEENPLYYGNNDLRLVFYGPRGEVLEKEYSYPVPDVLLTEGESRYELSVGKDAAGHDRSVLRYERGLASNSSFEVGWARAAVAGQPSSFVTAGLHMLGSRTLVGSRIAANGKGGTAWETVLRTRWGNVHATAEHLHLSDFSSPRLRPHLDPLRTRTSATLQWTWRPPGGRPLPTALQFSRSEAVSGRISWRGAHRIGTYVRDVGITNWLLWTDEQRDNVRWSSLDGRLVLTRRKERSGIVYELGYGLYPQFRIGTFAMDVEHPVSSGTTLRAGVRHAFQTEDIQISAGIQRKMAPGLFELNWTYDFRGDYFIGIAFTAGGVRGTDGFSPAERGAVRAGVASVNVFLDENGNGIRDPGEPGLAGVRVLVDGSPRPELTNERGEVLLDGLPVHDVSFFAVDEDSLPDLFWTPAGEGEAVVLRPGSAVRVDLPVVVRQEIFGATHLYDGLIPETNPRAVSGVQLQLVDEEQRVVAETVSGYRGFYVFPAVPMGKYSVRIEPEQGRRLGLIQAETIFDENGRHVMLQQVDNE